MLSIDKECSQENFLDHILTKGSYIAMDIFTQTTRYLAYNLRYLRRKKGMSQQQLAQYADMPRTTLTHMESGQGNPSLQNLLRVALALGVSVESLLARPRPEAVYVPAHEVPWRSHQQDRVRRFQLLPGASRGLAVERMVLEAGATLAGQPHLPGTHEYLTVIQGQVMVYLVGDSYTLSPGDVLAFPGHQRHSYRNPTAEKASAFSVVLPAPPAS